MAVKWIYPHQMCIENIFVYAIMCLILWWAELSADTGLVSIHDLNEKPSISGRFFRKEKLLGD